MMFLSVGTVLVSDVVGTAMVPLIIVGATSNKLLNVTVGGATLLRLIKRIIWKF